MKYVACLFLFFALLGLSFISLGQGTGHRQTAFEEIYRSDKGEVSIQYMLFPCSNEGSDRQYRFNSTYVLPKGVLRGKFDYELCKGGTATENFAVYLDTPGIKSDAGNWIQNTNHILRVYDLQLYDPEVEAQKQQQAEQQRQQQAEQQRQQEAEQQRLAEQRQAEAARKAEQTQQADESNLQLQNATQQVTDPTMKALYERNQQIGQNIQDPVERKKFLDQQAQSAQQSAQYSAIADAAAPLLADALDGLSNISLPDLKDTPNLGGIELGIANLLDPLIITNLTRSVSANPIGYYFKVAALRRRGISYNLSGHYLQLQNSNSALYWPDTKGQLTDFSGTLKATMFTADLSIGKTLMTKSGRLALYVGPFMSYGFNFTHSFVFTNGGQTYTNSDISSTQVIFGGQANAYWFITNGIAVTGGIRYNAFIDNLFDQNLGTANFKTYSAGLFFRFQ